MTRRGYSAIGLYHTKDSANVGGVMRAAGCYESALVVIEGARFQKHNSDTGKQYRHMPLLHANLKDSIPYDCVPVAVDLITDARPIYNYVHPERAFYIFGPEDGTLGKPITDWCRDVIYIPMRGCMNLAATVNVVLYDRQCKRSTK